MDKMTHELLLPHIIDIKEKVGGIEEHLKTLNGTVARQQKDIEKRRVHSEDNSTEINKIKIVMAKWAGGAIVIMSVINIILVRWF